MKKPLIFAIILLLALAAAAFYYFLNDKEKKQDQLTLYGNVDVRQVDLGFRVFGKVDRLFFEEGDLVPPGKLMATLDKQPYEDEVRQAAASVESIKSSLSNAEKVLKRREELVGDGGVSHEDLETALANRDTLAANLKEAEATLSIAITNLQFTELYSPTEGTILTRILEPGTVAKAGDAVYTLSITSPVWIRAYVAEPYLGRVQPGMSAKVYTDTKNGKVYTSHVGFISPVAEFTPKTVETTQLRTDLVYRLRLYAENPDKGLRQGMPVTVKLSLKETE